MTYGAVDYSGDTWTVSNLKPHVSIRFKGVFKGIQFGATPPFNLRDRPDLAVDLDWFMQRYPLELTDRAQTRLGEQLHTHAANHARVEELKRPDYTPSVKAGL